MNFENFESEFLFYLRLNNEKHLSVIENNKKKKKKKKKKKNKNL